ncbi:hypothetical protein ES703_18050 [subsurface metagenome]
MPLAEPNWRSDCASPALEICSKYFFLAACNLDLWARGTTCCPPTAIALSFLEPITAPRPERPAALPLLLIMHEIRLSFSPEGPMQVTLASLPNSA